MANKSLFSFFGSRGTAPATNTANHSGGQAYQLTPRHALAQCAVTGCLNQTYYASARTQLDEVRELALKVEPLFLARTALYAREQGFMKDMPALLCAVLAVRDGELLEKIFDRVIDNPRMLRNFVQIIRSGQLGRRSLGSRPKRLVSTWLNQRSDEQIFRASVGRAPSLVDVIKLSHPRPDTASRRALYGYLLGRDHDRSALPKLVQHFESYKADPTGTPPAVPFQMLTSLSLGRHEWAAIARQAGWQMTRMNLNTFARHGVFEVPGLTRLIAARLSNPKAIRRARVFPYQLMTAFHQVDDAVPHSIREALQDALEHALVNIPQITGRIVVCPDVSGSMSSPVTGYRRGSTSKVRCVDVAALISAALLRTNRKTEVLPFDLVVRDVRLNRRDSVMTNAARLAKLCGGGTNCSAPLARLNAQKAKADLVFYISDNESWADRHRGRGTGMMAEWETFRRRNPAARLVCLDIQPYTTTQAQERSDVLNIGGFSDSVFRIIARFANGQLGGDHLISHIDTIVL